MSAGDSGHGSRAERARIRTSEGTASVRRTGGPLDCKCQFPEHRPTRSDVRSETTRECRTEGVDRHEQSRTRSRASAARRTGSPGPLPPGRSSLQQPVGERGTSERIHRRVHRTLTSPGRRRRPRMDRIPGGAARLIPHAAQWQWQPCHPRPAWRSGSPGLVARWIPDCLRASRRDGCANLDYRPTGHQTAADGEGVSRQSVEPFLGQPRLVARRNADCDGWIPRRPADRTAPTIGAGDSHPGIG